MVQITLQEKIERIVLYYNEGKKYHRKKIHSILSVRFMTDNVE